MPLKLIDPGSLDRLFRRLTVLLVVIGVLATMAFLGLSAMMNVDHSGERGGYCSHQMARHYQGLRSYLNDFDEFFPLAWYVGGAALADDLSNLTYYRSLISAREGGDFEPLVLQRDVAIWGGDRRRAYREKLAEIHRLWEDGSRGWTRDYFSPEIAFRMPGPQELSYNKQTNYAKLVQHVSSSDRPLLGEVNASMPIPYPEGLGEHAEHEAEMMKGFSIVQAAGTDVFVGVGPSLRRAGDCSTSRFDFRHNRRMYVLFLDGHVDSVGEEDKSRLGKIHGYWNSINPAINKEPSQ